MKRTCRIIITLCLPLVLCAPVKAQHTGPFAGAFVGGNSLMKANSSDDLGSFSLAFDPALLGSAVVGWNFEPGNPVGEGRIELEYAHRGNRVDQVTFAEGSFNGSGTVAADSLLLNFFGVFHDKSRLSPYAGGGIGVARITASDLKVTGQTISSDSAVVFAYQLGAGVDFALTDYLNLDLGYRFFNTIRPTLTEANGHTFTMDYISHNIVLGLRVGF